MPEVDEMLQDPKSQKRKERMQKNMASYLSDPKHEKRQSVLKQTYKLMHSSQVEDIVFKPGSKDILCSVGVDKQVLLWDLRAGTQPILTLREVHKSDINTVDWSSFDEHLLATGSTDKLVKLLDLRRAAANDIPVIGCLHKH